ncbi:MAG: class I fructose-bisphosphate aldolase [Opitutaceae bacterium]
MKLESTALALVAPGKGILATDESFPTIGKRFAALDIPNTAESRQAYREMMFRTAGLEPFISSVILFDETLRQRTDEGVPLAELLAERGILPGIKVDKGTVPLPGSPKEKMTEGLDGLRDRLSEYRELGAHFTKWRAVISIGDGTPTRECIEVNARSLALFAALSQEAGLVPIVEPEVLMDGAHAIERCEEVTGLTLAAVFHALLEQRVALERMLLKTGMVLSGSECPAQADSAEVAAATLRCLRRFVPAAVPGIVFLSGGQSDVDATERLNAICRTAVDAPWALSFSFGRALQAPALEAWRGRFDNTAAAQSALHHRARCNSAAVQGRYSSQMDQADSSA